jgi:hypothetical protein
MVNGPAMECSGIAGLFSDVCQAKFLPNFLSIFSSKKDFGIFLSIIKISQLRCDNNKTYNKIANN